MLEKCETCDGCGKLANTKDREPWSRWLELPVRSSLALQLGIVTPITCPDCKGAGKVQKSIRKCMVCGCTDEDCSGCIERTGQPCYWVSENLCSACCDSEMPPDGELGDFLEE